MPQRSLYQAMMRAGVTSYRDDIIDIGLMKSIVAEYAEGR